MLGFVYFILFVPFPMSLNYQISIIVRYKVIKIGTWGSSGVITSEAESLISRPLCLLSSSHFYSLAYNVGTTRVCMLAHVNRPLFPAHTTIAK